MAAAARSLAARTAVKERVKLKLYQPFARMLGVSKAYFEDTFPEEMAVKTASIPDDNLVTPPANLAVPALQGLSYSFEEPDLKDLYLNLLAAASDDRRTEHTHPAFAEIIKQLASGETVLLTATLQSSAIPAVRLKTPSNNPPGSFEVRMDHLLDITEESTGQPEENPDAPTWIDNWQRLGLVSVSYSEHIAAEGSYDWVFSRPEYVRLSAPPWQRLEFDKGSIRPTNFGRKFLSAVVAPLEETVASPANV